MSKTTRTSKKQIHELEAMARETIDQSGARLYARNEYDATGKAYAVINGTRTAYVSNTALYDAVAEMIMQAAAADMPEPEPTEATRKGYAEKVAGYVVAELMDAYVKATGMTWSKYVETHDDEQAQALYRVASVEIIPEPERPAGYETASPEDYAAVAAVVSAIAADPAEHLADAAARALLDEYADVIGHTPANWSAESVAAYRIARHDIAHQIGSTASDREIVADMVERIAQAVRDDMPTGPEDYRPTYQRAELLAYLGEPDDYDVTAIEHDATAYDAATGRTVWAVDAETLAAIAERHQLQFYAPAF